MSRFNKHLASLDKLMEQNRRLSQDLDANYNKAKQKADFYHADRIGQPSRGALDPDEYAQAVEWHGKLAAAEAQRSQFWNTLPDRTRQKIAEIRRELAGELAEYFSADPGKLDAGTITLLDSGICTPEEYMRLIDKAQGNTTLIRIIGSYAAKAAEKLEAGHEEAKAADYRAVATHAQEIGKIAEEYLDHFDVYAAAIQAATDNPAMLEDLDSFADAAAQGFESLG